jgi:HEAT repeat protein
VASLLDHVNAENPDVRLAVVAALSWMPEDPRVVTVMIAALRDEDSDVRQTAAGALGYSEAEHAIPPLISALQDTQPEVAAGAIWALRMLKAQQAVAPLAKIFEDAEHPLREDAVRALARLGGEAWPRLIRYLREGDVATRRMIVDGVGWVRRDSGGADLLLLALKDEDVQVRRRAAQRLHRSEVPQAVAPLIEALQDDDPDVAAAAARALVKQEASQALPALRRAAAEDRRKIGDGRVVADEAREAVARIEQAGGRTAA